MFTCHYDGCDSESDLSSEENYGSVANPDSPSILAAANFEKLMNSELNAVMCEWSRSNPKNSDGKHVRFETQADSSDSDLFYDENEDELNSQWVAENLPGGDSKNSDAVLNCPGCMVVLSLDCRRDPRFRTRYTSACPINCLVDETHILDDAPAEKTTKQRRRNRSLDKDSSVGPGEARMDSLSDRFAVNCEVCGVQVGTKSRDSAVINFSNVIASHA
ncbi:unnamed protein product [Calicophoron daubneyi]|uniref:Uncharacterized protein n=1 Tax=Calicophoron daubneyi TaxID=300641 RepID=A0AAV2TS27_CALDB